MYNKIKKSIIFILLSTAFISCGSQSRVHTGDNIVTNNTVINDSTNNSFEKDEKDYLYNLFLTEYYWSEYTPRPFNSVLYTDPQSMINALTYKPIDKWSFVEVNGNSYGLYEQTTYGFGFYIKPDISGVMRVAYIDMNSPADSRGFYRGDILLEINTQPASQELFNEVVSQKGKVASFHILRNGIDIYLSMSPQYYNYNVAKGNIIKTNGGKSVGYLRFDLFSDDATTEIEPIFDEFYNYGIDTLVVDMRYNGGGYLNTASILLDKLTRDRDGEVQFRSIWNEANSAKNSFSTFETDENSLNLKEIVFLVTNNTASASELVINSLSASTIDIKVSLVGSTTHGKPVGMEGKLYNNNIYYLINFKLENSDGFGDYFNGIPVTCPAIDDITHQMGDSNESMLMEALHYIDTGSCR
jgi:hypothetical protein